MCAFYFQNKMFNDSSFQLQLQTAFGHPEELQAEGASHTIEHPLKQMNIKENQQMHFKNAFPNWEHIAFPTLGVKLG